MHLECAVQLSAGLTKAQGLTVDRDQQMPVAQLGQLAQNAFFEQTCA